MKERALETAFVAVTFVVFYVLICLGAIISE